MNSDLKSTDFIWGLLLISHILTIASLIALTQIWNVQVPSRDGMAPRYLMVIIFRVSPFMIMFVLMASMPFNIIFSELTATPYVLDLI